MAKKRNIVQYRERLDKTIASTDLTNDQILKKLVKNQLLRPSELEVEGYKEKLVETRTAEVSNFLDMMRSASVDDGGGSSTSRTDWKLKQDNEDFRVMYREGPEGTPFHTLLVEGFVDGPVDLCLCLSWEASLYKKWWPQFTVPTFKVIAADCLHKVQIGEQVSLVRMKVPWPLSNREAIVHYYLFEYFQDDLIVVLLNSVPESKNIDGTIDGFNNDAIPEAKDAVRIDLVGGFVMQKVTSERSYFRIIANLDIKLDFVPPSLINFISRQLIGSGFRLYQKVVASFMNHNDKEISKVLGDSLYVRIREALYSISGSNATDGKEVKQVASVLPAEKLIQSKQDEANDVSRENRSNQYANNHNGESLDKGNEEIVQIEEVVNKVHDIPIEEGDARNVLKDNRNSEIVGADSEENGQIEEDIKRVHHIPIEEDDTRSALNGKRNVNISSDVKRALETLERAISMVQEPEFHSCRSFASFDDEESHCMENGGAVDLYSAKVAQLSSKNEVSAKVSSSNLLDKTSEEEPGTNSEIQNFRHTGINPKLKEVNYNKVVPASPEQNPSRPIEVNQVDSYVVKNETTLDQTIPDNKKLNSDTVQDMLQKKLNTLVTQGISSDVPKQSNKGKKYRYCCFLH